MSKKTHKLLLIIFGVMLSLGWLLSDTLSQSEAKNQPITFVQDALAPLQTEEPADNGDTEDGFTPSTMPATLRVRGVISNGTADGTVPDGLTVNLFSIEFDQSGQPVAQLALEKIVAEGTTFSVDALPVSINAGVVAQVIYNDVPFVSEIILAHQETDGIAELSVTIYEVTTDTSEIYFSEVWYIISASPEEDLAEIYNWYFIRNDTDRVVYDGENGGIHIPLPSGAFEIRLDDTSGRFQIDESGEVPILIDDNPLRPSEEDELIVQYLLPYDNDELTFTQTLKYPVDTRNVYVARIFDLKFEADGFTSGDVTELRGLGEYNRYSNETVLPAGETFTFNISGEARLSAEQDYEPANEESFLAQEELVNLLLIVMLLSLMLGFVYRFLLNQ